MVECMLTTFDNPFDPFDQFDEWLSFDKEKGYNSCERLGRIVVLSDDMTEKEVDEATERAINQIIIEDPFNIYKKFIRNT